LTELLAAASPGCLPVLARCPEGKQKLSVHGVQAYAQLG
jgi:hypothetical protein